MVLFIVDRILSSSQRRPSVYFSFFFTIGLCLSFVGLNLYEFNYMLFKSDIEKEKVIYIESDKPTYMLHGQNVDSGYLRHVNNVLQRLGYRRVINSTKFDLLWSHVYPFGDHAPFSKGFLRNLKPYQKVNHFPGSGYFTNKADLAATKMKYVPLAFQIPSEKDKLILHAKEFPNAMFVQKSNAHRGIKILKVGDMNLNQTGTFVQEYIANPLLINGYKFDIGIYTILTSVDPLRVYIYNGDVLLRFCPKPYEPFDEEDVDRYVVGDDYIPIWEVPSLRRLYNDLKFGMKESLNAYLRDQGQNPQKIWDQIEDSIRTVFLKKEDLIIKILNNFANNRNFFEMARFDFVVDSDLNVYLMEANMSPNLSSEHFPPNKLLYENVIFNLFALVGIGRHIKSSSLQLRSLEEEQMQVSIKNVVVYSNECTKERCNSCTQLVCLLCKHCLTPSSIAVLQDSYLEHINKLDCKRVFPPPLNSDIKPESLNLEDYSPENKIMTLWFLGKCLQDKTWC